MRCTVCGDVDEEYDENAIVHHENTPKHICNLILNHYSKNKMAFSRNRDGIVITCNAESEPLRDLPSIKIENEEHHKTRIQLKPGQGAKFIFNISNNMKNEDLLIAGIQLAHPQPTFAIENNKFVFGGEPFILKKKSTITNEVTVNFKASDIGHYEMPIMFTFYRKSDEKTFVFIREMVSLVQENPIDLVSSKNPYKFEEWKNAEHFIPANNTLPLEMDYKIPPLLKMLLPNGLDENALEGINEKPVTMEKLRLLVISTRAIFDEGPTQDNYRFYFHNLLWWEEIISRINLRKFNMSKMTVQSKGDVMVLEVPGLAEKRPSLIRGDRVYLRPVENSDLVFEGTINFIEENYVHLANLNHMFKMMHSSETLYDIRFMMSRVPMERMHAAVAQLDQCKQAFRVFPQPCNKTVKLKTISRFYNPLVAGNSEQLSAVRHIVSGSSGRCPYLVFGPPGTGKTMTIVESIIQLVVQNPRNRVMVCTDSNMAADHIALILLQYNKVLNISNFLLRANSQCREWSVMPPELHAVSNGTSYDSFHSVDNAQVALYRIFVTTLLHAAKYGTVRSQRSCKVKMTHLFIDEAAQASEPAALVPITALLAPAGRLVLAGDPKQLGPVCISKEAKIRGLGMSLMERLIVTYPNLYENNPKYMTMLVQNFRSDPDILAIPNELFYENSLKALAPADPLSRTSVLGLPGGDRAVVFHGVESTEQKIGLAPSYFNEKEIDMCKRYTLALINKHHVSPKDIGIIAPYIRQVYKIKSWLQSANYSEVEVGTVEAFQGKEKRVILVSTVRANCRLLDYDAKYSLGFLVDDKRYNVTLTRAKAKIVIIGNPTCLTRDLKWRKYMNMCKELGCYYGSEAVQMERSSTLLTEIARTRFDKCRLTDELNRMKVEKKQKR